MIYATRSKNLMAHNYRISHHPAGSTGNANYWPVFAPDNNVIQGDKNESYFP